MTDESIVAAALAIPDPSERAVYLDRVCAGQPDVRREVEELLAAHAADNVIDRPPADLGRTGAYEPPADEPPAAATGDHIGPYRLMEQIGEGGFGLVFVAEQSEPVRRKVALKVLKPGMDTRDVVARFEAERQALALMDHPNIAKVLDGGTIGVEPRTPVRGRSQPLTDVRGSGRPYFVMELVRGVPITEFCDQNKLPPRERLALFVQVCQAVQHAHQKGVIHRDLKPSNVLVTVVDGMPVPKVIDFGVAKALGQSLTEKTVYTRFAQMIGTPLYMSPEQAQMSGVDVDTRSDVYSLGVLLYELLTGTTPFDKDRFHKAAFDEIRRIIREEEPPRPSTRLSTSEALPSIAAARQTEPVKLTGLVRGELDWIVMRCLEKDRNRRYDSANSLSKDVQRYLAGDAVEACPPTVGYRLRKTFRRHKAAVLIAGGFAALLLMGIAITTWLAIWARNAEAGASRKRDEAIAAHQAVATERDNVAKANDSLRRLTAEQRRTLYDTSMNLAQAAWDGGNPGRTFALLRQQIPKPGEDDLRGFEWYYWERFAHQDLKTVRLASFGDGNGPQRSAKLSRDGSRVAAFVSDPTHTDNSLKLWDAETGKEIWSMLVGKDPGSYPFLRFSDNGRRLVTSRTFGSGEGTAPPRVELHVWDTITGKPIYANNFQESSYLITPVLSPDGSRLAFMLYGQGPGSDQHLSVRRLPDGKEIFRYPPDRSAATALSPVFSPDGKRLAAVADEVPKAGSVPTRTLKIWDVDHGRELQRMPLALVTMKASMSFSPDGARLATPLFAEPNDQVVIWDTVSGKKLQTLNVPAESGEYTMEYPMAFDPSGKRLAVASDARAFLLNAEPEQPANAVPLRHTFRGHESFIRDVAFGGNGSRLVTLDAQGVVKQWDPEPRERRLHTPFGERIGPSATAIPNRDGSRIAFVPARGDPEHGLRLTDGSGRLVGESVLPAGHSHGAAFSRDGRTFALSWHEEPLGVGVFSLQVWDAATGKQMRRLRSPEGQYIGPFALSPDGSRVVAVVEPLRGNNAAPPAAMTIWESRSGRVVLSRRAPENFFYPTYSPDGRWIVYSDYYREDRVVWLNAETGEPARVLKVPKGWLGRGTDIFFSRDGRRMAVVPKATGATPSLPVWEVDSILRGENPDPIITLTGHGAAVSHVEFSPDDRRVLTSGGGVTKLWDAVSGREVLTLKANGSKTGDAFFSPDGNTIWGGLDENGRLWGWDGTPEGKKKIPAGSN